MAKKQSKTTKKRRKRAKTDSQKQGEKFENAFCEFLKVFLAECFGVKNFITEPIRQNAGEQYGRDITTRWEFKKADFNWWFECKSHLLKGESESRIHRKELADKIIEVLVNNNRPNCYCVVSANKEMDNWLREKIPLINKMGHTQIIWWSPNELALQKCIAMYPEIWKKVYGRKKIANEYLAKNGDEKKELFKLVKENFTKANKQGIGRVDVLKEASQVRRGGRITVKEERLNEEQLRNTESTLTQIKYSKIHE